MTFNETLAAAQRAAKINNKRSLQPVNGISDKKYKHVTYGRGSFYFEGLMYHIDDGSPVDSAGSFDLEMLRIGDMINELH